MRRLMAGALWTPARVSGHGMRTNSACPHCGAAHKDKVHVLWDCREWESATGTWRPWLSDAATAIPHLGPRDQWPSCLRKVGLFPLRLTLGVDQGLLGEFLYRLCGMYLAVLAARMAANRGDQPGHGDSLFPDQPRPRPRNLYSRDDFVGPLSGDAIRHQPRLQPGTGGGPRLLSKTWSGGPGIWPGCWGRRRSSGLGWPRIMRRLWGGRSHPPRTTGYGVRTCRLGSEPQSRGPPPANV